MFIGVLWHTGLDGQPIILAKTNTSSWLIDRRTNDIVEYYIVCFIDDRVNNMALSLWHRRVFVVEDIILYI